MDGAMDEMKRSRMLGLAASSRILGNPERQIGAPLLKMHEGNIQVLVELLRHLVEKVWILWLLLSFWSKLDEELLEAALDLRLQALLNLRCLSQLLMCQIVRRLWHVLLVNINVIKTSRSAGIAT